MAFRLDSEVKCNTYIYTSAFSIGGINKCNRFISEMEQRENTLSKYDLELSELNDSGSVGVDKFHKILTYLLRISNYPMEPKTAITQSICEILQNGKGNVNIYGECHVLKWCVFNCKFSKQYWTS